MPSTSSSAGGEISGRVAAPRGGAARLLALSLLIWVAAGVVLVGLDRYGRDSRRMGSAIPLGTAGVPTVRVEQPVDAYRLWRSRGFHGRTVLYVAANWERIDPKALNREEDPRRHYPLDAYRLPDETERSFLDNRTFLFISALKGISRRFIAVVSPEAYQEAVQKSATAKNIRNADGVLYTTYNGLPRWFTTPEHLFSPGEPVLLYVGASVFRSIAPSELLARLKGAGVATDAAVLCAEAENPQVGAGERGALAEFARLLERGGP